MSAPTQDAFSADWSPLIDQAARVLDGLSLREDFVDPDDRVFVNEVGGMLGDDALRDALYEAMKAAGIDRLAFPAGPFRFHDLRHCFGALAARIFPLVDVQALMGHAQIETTMIYPHSVPRNDAARRFTEAVESQGASGTAARALDTATV